MTQHSAGRAVPRAPEWWPTAIELEALRSAIEPPEAAARRWRRVADDVIAARRGAGGRDVRRILPAVYLNVAQSDPELPRRETLRRLYAESRGLNLVLARRGREVVERLRGIGVVPMPLKGLALQRHYPPGGRPVGDLDLLVPLERVADALELLCAEGFEPDDPVDPTRLSAKHSCCLQREGWPEVDLHWVVEGRFVGRGGKAVSVEPFWRRSREVVDELGTVRRIDPAHLLLHVVTHGARIESRARVRWVLDALQVLRSVGDDLDWSELEETALSFRVARQIGAALELVATLDEALVPADVRRRLQRARAGAAERLLWFLDQRRARRPLVLDLQRTLRQHLSLNRHLALPTALGLYPLYLRDSGLLLGPVGLLRHVRRRRRETAARRRRERPGRPG